MLTHWGKGPGPFPTLGAGHSNPSLCQEGSEPSPSLPVQAWVFLLLTKSLGDLSLLAGVDTGSPSSTRRVLGPVFVSRGGQRVPYLCQEALGPYPSLLVRHGIPSLWQESLGPRPSPLGYTLSTRRTLFLSQGVGAGGQGALSLPPCWLQFPSLCQQRLESCPSLLRWEWGPLCPPGGPVPPQRCVPRPGGPGVSSFFAGVGVGPTSSARYWGPVPTC